jgi:protein-glutamine gamma-glutamyltransferase
MTLAEHDPLTRGRLLWSASVIVGASLPHWLVVPPWIPLMLVGCVLWRLEGQRRGLQPPTKRTRILLTLLAFAAVFASFRTINGVEAGSALLVVMVALKFVEARTHRDQVVLTIIAYFLVFASLIDQQSVFIGAYLLVFAFVTTAGLLQLGRRGPLRPIRATSALAARMLLQALPVMLLLFVLFPRLSGPLWALPNEPQRATTGLSDTMSPGAITELALSEEVAFRAEFAGSPPPADLLYWRGTVLSMFDGRSWSRRWSPPQVEPSEIQYLGEPVEYRVLLEPNGRGWTFALDMPREWSGVDRMAMTSEYQLVARPGREVGSRLDYSVTSYPIYRAVDPLGDGERLLLTRLPDDANPRTLALVRGWRDRGLDADGIIAEALRLFREQPFHYTLTPPPLGEHSVDEFLFDTRAGFCGHYASAFAVMMRAAGVPTRIVTGYQGGERNRFGEYYIVRQSDAHAWVEVRLDERGWVRVDPTAAVAPERIELGAAGSVGAGFARRGFDLFRTARYAWDALDTYWYAWVIGYGETRQRMLLRGIGLDWATPGVLSAAAIAGVALILALLAGYHGFVQRRQRRTDPAARHFAAFRRKLARRGIPPLRVGEAPMAYAARAGDALPDLAPAIRQITTAYVRARYEPDVGGAALMRLERLVQAFRPITPGARASRGTRSPATAPGSDSG